MGSLGEPKSITLHGRTYLLPSCPTVVVCVDGFDPTYLQAGVEDGILPTMASFIQSGFHATAQCAMPSLTNPNNMSIITGAPTAAHGISGNYYLDKATGEEHMVLDDSLVTGSTILELMADAGVRVVAVTAKDKLRKIIRHGLAPGKDGSICFSAQLANEATQEENGIGDVESWLGRGAPPQYSGDLSIYVLDAGIKLLKEGRGDLFYLTLSDFIQHKYAPRSKESNSFLQALDARLGELVKLGAVVAVTADHGMSDKSNDAGEPSVLFLEDELNRKWPEAGARVICPIADPFVVHHGALGGFVRVHLTKTPAAKAKELAEEMVDYCQKLPKVEVAYTGEDAARVFEMPPDREGDLVVVSKANAVIGSRKDEHDLSQLQGFRLRSHGGLSEQAMPLMASVPTKADPQRAWRNFDAFDIALNWEREQIVSFVDIQIRC